MEDLIPNCKEDIDFLPVILVDWKYSFQIARINMKRPYLLNQIQLTYAVHTVCALLGPRQAGKTTLAKMYAQEHFENDFFFFDLENPRDIERLQNPLLAFSQVTQKLIVIDEIQRNPDLFPILRVLVDNAENKHIFLILGSASRDLIKQSSESLAGRIGYIEVMPFSLEETHESTLLWTRGGFPKSYLADTDAQSFNWRKNYISTFLEQDIPTLGFQIPPQQMRRFWLMLAHYHGQLLNASELGNAMGISHHTVKRYIDILAGTFMIRVLEPWFENISKRQIKSPKIYFRDSGILHALLNITNDEQLYANPKIGASWEGFAIEEVIRYAHTSSSECFFWSTQSGAELDLFMIKDGKRIGFECKYSDTPKTTKSMHIVITDLILDHVYVIVPGNFSYAISKQITACGLDAVSTIFK